MTNHPTSTPSADSAITPRDAQMLLASGQAVLVDVREPDEHARERIDGARLIPLGQFTADKAVALGSAIVLIHCKSGRRGGDAVARCVGLDGRGISVRNIRGGIEGWRAAGLSTRVDAARPRLGVLQQTQLLIGLALLACTLLGVLLNPWFLAVPLALGIGLVHAGTSGTCGLATAIARLPWNRTTSCARGSCNAA